MSVNFFFPKICFIGLFFWKLVKFTPDFYSKKLQRIGSRFCYFDWMKRSTLEKVGFLYGRALAFKSPTINGKRAIGWMMTVIEEDPPNPNFCLLYKSFQVFRVWVDPRRPRLGWRRRRMSECPDVRVSKCQIVGMSEWRNVWMTESPNVRL